MKKSAKQSKVVKMNPAKLKGLSEKQLMKVLGGVNHPNRPNA